MDTLPVPSTSNLLATASVGRGWRMPAAGPRTPTAPGLYQVRPTASQQQVPTSGRHETGPVTPYQQQVYPPPHTSRVRMAATKAKTTPTAGQGRNEAARQGEGV